VFFLSNCKRKMLICSLSVDQRVVISTLRKYRTNECFRRFWQEAEEESDKLNSAPPMLPRSRRPHRIDEAPNTHHQQQEPEDIYRRTYFELLDNMIFQLQSRFCSRDFEMFSNVERLLTDSTSCLVPVESLLREVANSTTMTSMSPSWCVRCMTVEYSHVTIHFRRDSQDRQCNSTGS
jgi:hypothetical protein